MWCTTKLFIEFRSHNLKEIKHFKVWLSSTLLLTAKKVFVKAKFNIAHLRVKRMA